MTAAGFLSEFVPATTPEWEEAIRKDLKGADYARKLIWQTGEGFSAKPYYRSEDTAGLEQLDSAAREVDLKALALIEAAQMEVDAPLRNA